MMTFLLTGSILGLSAGFAPGPLLVLIISETLQHDLKAGMKVALAPVLTDLPIIIFSLFVLVKLSRFHYILAIISFLGAFFILYLGIKNIKIKGVHIDKETSPERSLQKGILANALSPHPYLFWLTVGGPTSIKAMNLGLFTACAFILCFYVLLVGSKIILALLVGRSRSYLQGKTYLYTMRMLGFILILLAGFLFQDGLHLLRVI